MIRYNASDDNLWRRTHKLKYWEKDIWIIPIHRASASHWVLCCVFLQTREILLFDSFAERHPWKHEVKEIMVFITRLVLLANRKDQPLYVVTEEGWIARPVSVDQKQTNGVDCGLWVLAVIAAVLSGSHVTGLLEGEMGRFRELLLDHVLVLPSL